MEDLKQAQNNLTKKEKKKRRNWEVIVISVICIGIGSWLTWFIFKQIITAGSSSTAAPGAFMFVLGIFLVLKFGLRKGLGILATFLLVLVGIWAIIWFSASPEYRAGMNAFDKKDFATAIEKFNLVLEKEPDNAEVYLKRGTALWHLDKPSEALQDLNRAIKLDYPFKDESYSMRGLVFADLKNPNAAAQDFTVAFKERPNPYDVCNRGIMYIRLKRYDLAVRDFNRALSLDGDYANALRGMGEALYYQEKWQEALNYYNKYVKSGAKVSEGLKARIEALQHKITKD